MSESNSSYCIQRLPEADRPREKLKRLGAEAMSSADLIAVVLGNGTKGKPVLQIANEMIRHFGSLKRLSEATIEELRLIKGVGFAKAIQLKASFSLGLRASKQAIPPKYRIDHPLHAYHLVKDELEHEKRELFMIILQDAKGFVISHQVVAIGTLTNSLVHPREVFYPAIRHKAASIILVHNHPSGDPTPSKQDYDVTKILIEAGQIIGIGVNDHLIIGEERYVSLREIGVNF